MLSESVIINGFECDGSWFLPEQPEIKLYGHLNLVPGKPSQLKIIGVFPSFNSAHPPGFICGIATEGIYVTLYKCLKTNETMGGHGQVVTTFSSEMVLLGAHFPTEDALDFEDISFKYHNLDEWLSVSGFDISPPNTLGQAEIKYRQPDSISLYSSNDYDVSIFFGYRGPNYNGVQKHVTIEQSASVVVSMQENRSLKNYLRVHKHIANFLHLATRDSVYIKDISATVKASASDDDSTEREVSIQVFVAVDTLPPDEAMSPHKMAFVYDDIKERLTEVMSAWFQKSDSLRHACSVLFETLYGRKLYLDNKLIGVTQAAEAIHRRVFGGSYEDRDLYLCGLYEQLVNAIPQDLSPDYRISLISRLKYANEFSLRKRIRELKSLSKGHCSRDDRK